MLFLDLVSLYLAKIALQDVNGARATRLQIVTVRDVSKLDSRPTGEGLQHPNWLLALSLIFFGRRRPVLPAQLSARVPMPRYGKRGEVAAKSSPGPVRPEVTNGPFLSHKGTERERRCATTGSRRLSQNRVSGKFCQLGRCNEPVRFASANSSAKGFPLGKAASPQIDDGCQFCHIRNAQQP
jgi:hypothetical protein